jgi:toxin CcdB
MAQFDVHKNMGLNKSVIPFVVVVQSSIFDDYRRRLVVPLVLRSEMPQKSSSVGSRLNPLFRFSGADVVLHPLEMVSIPLKQLGDFVCCAANDGSKITDALDEVLTRSWG